MKKQYEAPELEVIVLEQSDIITKSGYAQTGIGSVQGDKDNQGQFDAWN